MKKSRNKRKLEYIKLKNSITKTNSNFSTYDEIDENSHWADICFFGKNKQIYNATIMTTKCAWKDILSKKAWEVLDAKIEPGEKLFEIVELEGYTLNKKMSGPTTVDNPPRKSLAGKTASDFLEEKEKELALDKSITVCESFEVLKGYRYGVGLNLVIHEKNLSQEAIEKAIKRFIELEEKSWIGKEKYHFHYEEKVRFLINKLKDDFLK